MIIGNSSVKKTVDTKEENSTEIQNPAQKKRWILRIMVFLLIFCALFSGVNYFFQPVWTSWNNYSRTTGFYEQPDNTVEVIFLGPSDTVNSITPAELYEEYGICAYNLASEQQPLLAAYYWTEEAYRLHSETLTTVVLDAVELFTDPVDSFYHKAIDGMEFSSVKLKAVADYENYDIRDTLSFLVPLFSYHDRWTSIGQSDFEKSTYVTESGTRGYHLSTTRYLDSYSWSAVPIQTGLLDETAEPAEIDEDHLQYLNQLVEFCQEHDLQLILIKSPRSGWSSANHNAVQLIAEENELEFLDFNFNPLMEELDVNFALDMEGGSHANYYAAHKLTEWLGQWLTENADVTDVREDSDYSFLKEEMIQYHELVTDIVQLKEETDPIEYIKLAMQSEDNEVFLLVKDSAVDSMTDEMRNQFSELGLTTLSELTYRSAYIGIIENGKIVYEETNNFSQDAYDTAVEAAEFLDDEEAETLLEPFSSISYVGTIDGDLRYTLESGGMNNGNIASCIIEGTEYAVNTRGLNIVVYNKEQNKVIDSAVFDLHASSDRIGLNLAEELETAEDAGVDISELSDLLQSYALYNRRVEVNRTVAQVDEDIDEDGVLSYLQTYMEMDGLIMFISVKDEAAKGLSEQARSFLREIGLEVLSDLEYRDSYIGIINDGEIVYEMSDHGEEPITYSGIIWSVTSGGYESGNVSSIVIDGTEYSPSTRGINIVVYDTVLDTIVDTSVFDTFSAGARIPE